MTDVAAYAHDQQSAPSDVAFNKFMYDIHGNLVTEYQSHGAPVNVNTSPRIDYSWDYQTAHNGGDNHNRLNSMTYPARTSNSLRRAVELGYTTGADDLLSRIATITSKHDGTTAKQLTEYSYFGTSRVASTKFGYDGTAPVMTLGVTDPVLDRFGMPRDLFYDVVQANQDLRFVATRDVMGSPTSVSTTLRNQANTRSWTFAYDALNRLDVAASGQLSGGAISSPSLHGYDWSLDSRDNWAGDGSNPGLTVSANGSTVDQITHTVEKDSSITSVTSSGPATVYYVYDDAGNLVDDTTYTYQYDAWNRLVKVTDKATSAFVLHYTYDGLGRLVRRQGPYPGYPNEKRVEHYYYDGSRRIQEVMTDPVSNSEEEVESEEEPTYSYNIWTTREYVWSPHGTDVLLAQFEHITSAGDFAQPWFGVHDHSGDLVGIVDVDGTVREQRSYSPYGELLFVETFGKKTAGAASAGNPIVKLGHDGLFFDRFNASILAPPHAVGARGVYYNVNRSYSPHLGRFLQSDPNATGQMLVAARHATISGADALNLLSDGFNLYAGYGARPTVASDPEGLFLGFGGLTAGQALAKGMQYGGYASTGYSAVKNLTAFIRGEISFQQMATDLAIESAFTLGTAGAGKALGWALGKLAKTGKSIWKSLDPFERGRQLERMRGANLLSPNFPVMDRLQDGVAASIKSIDLDAATYQTASGLRSKLKGYVDDVVNFKSKRWGEDFIEPAHYPNGKMLEVVIPHAGSPEQRAVIDEIRQYATSKGILFDIVEIP